MEETKQRADLQLDRERLEKNVARRKTLQVAMDGIQRDGKAWYSSGTSFFNLNEGEVKSLIQAEVEVVEEELRHLCLKIQSTYYNDGAQ